MDITEDESLLEEVNDPYAEMVIGGNKKSKPNKQYGVNDKKTCAECPTGFNSKSKKVF